MPTDVENGAQITHRPPQGELEGLCLRRRRQRAPLLRIAEDAGKPASFPAASEGPFKTARTVVAIWTFPTRTLMVKSAMRSGGLRRKRMLQQNLQRL